MTKSQAKPAADKFKVFEDWLVENGAEFSQVRDDQLLIFFTSFACKSGDIYLLLS